MMIIESPQTDNIRFNLLFGFVLWQITVLVMTLLCSYSRSWSLLLALLQTLAQEMKNLDRRRREYNPPKKNLSQKIGKT